MNGTTGGAAEGDRKVGEVRVLSNPLKGLGPSARYKPRFRYRPIRAIFLGKVDFQKTSTKEIEWT